MLADRNINESRERLLNAAEALFIDSGFAAIKLKHIAERLGVKESSIYYHFPKGKEDLFVAVMHRSLSRHRHGVSAAIAAAGDDWIAQLRAVCHWLVSQPAMDVMRLSKSDLPAIDPAAALEIEEAIYTSVNLPIKQILDQAAQSGHASIADSDLLAGMLIATVASIDIIKSRWNPRSKIEMVDILLDSWVDGLRRITR
ncbi:MAG: TetR/AcrR family transcriptional regulator [Chloroflexota bacterium]|nr:TetR/AcrR family transcriptional regulator [Chloroflexota bacterium]